MPVFSKIFTKKVTHAAISSNVNFLLHSMCNTKHSTKILIKNIYIFSSNLRVNNTLGGSGAFYLLICPVIEQYSTNKNSPIKLIHLPERRGTKS